MNQIRNILIGIGREDHEKAQSMCTGEKFNSTTLVEDGGGQYVGNIAELAFSHLLDLYGITHEFTGKDVFDYDFNAQGALIDIKAQPNPTFGDTWWTAWVNDSQKNLSAQYYVFANCIGSRDKCIGVEFVGWMRKKDFWTQGKQIKKGEKRVALTYQADAHAVRYEQLEDMRALIDNLVILTLKNVLRGANETEATSN